MRKEDRGTYYCVADNSVGRGTRRNIDVEVEFAPVITAPRPRLGQALQYDMDLECHVEAYPPPAINWLKDDVVLSNNQHYSISHFATADEYTDTTIRVITIEKRQYGQYVCKAANKLGIAETRVELFGKHLHFFHHVHTSFFCLHHPHLLCRCDECIIIHVSSRHLDFDPYYQLVVGMY